MPAKVSTFQSMTIIYGSLVSGVILFGIVTIFALGSLTKEYEMDIMSYVAIILAIMSPSAGFILYNKKMQSVQDADVQTRINTWRTATITRAALIEMPCLFCVANILISGGYIFLYLYVALVALMVFNFPTRTKIKNDIQLTDEELDASAKMQ